MTPNTEENRKQMVVDHFFDSNATYWRDTYEQKDILGVIYQRRQAVALNYVDSLHLPKTARVLEIGCGAGLMTMELAKRGFSVEAFDSAQSMINLTLQLATQTGLMSNINAHIGDAHNLLYEKESFDLIIALGVIPWLCDFEKALQEMQRVTRRGGYIIVSMDNANRATTLLDPSTFPAIATVVGIIKRKLQKAGLLSSVNLWINAPTYRRHSQRHFIRSLNKAGLTLIKNSSVGFGPFTFFNHIMFPESIGKKINHKLQEYADKNYPFLRSTGSQFIVLATKK
jgi:ubiquinone/menaquinone biosynthesis C-methylase UbiE